MKIEKINIDQKLKKINEHWSPRVFAEMNDYQFKLAKVKDEFIWHKHEETDEAFFVINGRLTIELKEEKVFLEKGEMILRLLLFFNFLATNLMFDEYKGPMIISIKAKSLELINCSTAALSFSLS